MLRLTARFGLPCHDSPSSLTHSKKRASCELYPVGALVSEALKESHMTLQGLRNLSAAYSALSSSLQTMTTNWTFIANQTDAKCKLLLDVDYAATTGKLLFLRLRFLCRVFNLDYWRQQEVKWLLIYYRRLAWTEF